MASTLNQLVSDPDFQKLAPGQQKQILLDNFPDFAQLSSGDQDNFLKDYQGSKTSSTLDLPKAGQPPKVPGLTAPTKAEDAFAPLNQTAGQLKALFKGNREEKFQAASDLLKGLAPTKEDAPFAVAAAGAAGAAGTLGSLAGSVLGGKLAQGLTSHAGGSAGAQDFANTAGSLAGGAIGGGLAAHLSPELSDLAAFKQGFSAGPRQTRSGTPAPTEAKLPDIWDAAHAAAHFPTGGPSLVIKAAKSGLGSKVKAGYQAMQEAKAARLNPQPATSGYGSGPGHFGEELPPEVPQTPPSRPDPLWTQGPGPQAPKTLDLSSISSGELPSGRTPGPATPQTPLPRPTMMDRYKIKLGEAGFQENPPPPTPPSPKAEAAKKVAIAKNQALKAEDVSKLLWNDGKPAIPPDKLELLRDPEVPNDVKEPVWNKIEDLSGKKHSSATRSQILDAYEQLLKSSSQNTLQTPIPER